MENPLQDCNNVLTFLVVVATAAAADFHCYDYDEGEEKIKLIYRDQSILCRTPLVAKKFGCC